MSAVDGWIKTQLGEIATLVKGISYASEDYCGAGEGAVFITIKCVSKAGGFKREGIKYFKGSIAPSQLLQPGELLIANTDLTRAGDIVGCPMVVPIMSGEIITMSMDLSKIVEDDAKIDRNFLYYKLMTDSVRHFMKDHASGSTVLHLQTRAVPNLELEIPTSKLEQTKIAEVLLTVDRAIEQTEALIAKQQRIKTGLMQDLLTRGIDEHGNLRSEQTHKFKDSPLGRIPMEWEVQPCISLCREIVVGIVIRPMQYYRPDGVPVLRSANVKVNRITSEALVFMSDKDNEKLSKSRLRKGDLVTVRTGYPGTTGVIPPELDGSNCVDIVISRPNHEKVRSDFLSIWINSDHGKRQVLEGQGGLAQQHFNVGEMRTLLVKVPDINEQKIIENLLMLQSSAIDELTENQQKLHSIKTALMQDLLTGKTRVTSLLNNTEVGV